MKNQTLLNLNYLILMFGTTIYMGVLWALRFFWFPGWKSITTDVVQEHFIGPTSRATVFFTIVVPVMFVCNLIMIWKEWKTKYKWTSLIAMLGIVGSTVVGKLLIIPINDEIALGQTNQVDLTIMLQRWMDLNDIRWILMTIMWLALMYFFLTRNDNK
ncbi:MAG: hypothetical protein V4683_13620 [Bacteroidota bacterium]